MDPIKIVEFPTKILRIIAQLMAILQHIYFLIVRI